MAYINRLSDITNKLDINIENQVIGNDKLNNIDDNIETIRNLNNNTNTKLDTLHTDLDTTIHGDLTSTNTKLDTLHTDITSTNTKLDTLHTDLDGLTFDGSSNLNVNIASGSISISSVNIKDSAGNNLNSTSNALNSYITNASIPVTGTFYQATQPVSGTVSSKLQDGGGTAITSTAVTAAIRGVDTSASLYTTNGTTRTALTSTTNDYSKIGLNIYQIYPKKIQYLLYGINSNGAANMLIGGVGCTLAHNTVIFGKSNPQTFSAVMTAGLFLPRTIKYHYTDVNGDLKTNGSAIITALNTAVTLGTNFMSINKAWINNPGPTDILAIRPFTASVAGNTIGTSKIDEQYNGIITVPNGYIGYLSAVNVYSPSASWMGTLKWEEDGNRYPSWLAFNTSNQVHTAGFGGSIGGIYYPGETIGMARFTSMAGGAMGGMFVLEPI